MNRTTRTRILGAGFAAALLLGGAACGDDDAGVDIGEETNLDDGVVEDLGENEGDFEGEGGGETVED